jgi:hypothetical protein
MITLFLTEPKPKQYVLLTASGEPPEVATPLEITRNAVVLNVREGMTVVKTLLDQGFAVDMDTAELKGFLDHYMTREEITAAFGVSE